mgnify:CR=1 FL=1
MNASTKVRVASLIAAALVTFGVVGLIPGNVTINAHHVQRNLDAAQATATIRTGGRPGVEAANAARSITVSPTSSVRPIASPTNSRRWRTCESFRLTRMLPWTRR